MRGPRLLLVGGALQALLGLVLALSLAAPLGALPPAAHVLAFASGLALAALAAASALAPAFTGREAPSAAWAWPALAALAAADALLLWNGRAWALGGALLLAAALPAVGALRSPRLAAREETESYRAGDRLAAAALAAGAGLVAAAGVLLVAAPRGLPWAGLVPLLGGVLALATGALAFLLPRVAGAAAQGVALLAASLGVLVLACAALALGFSLPSAGGFRSAAAGVLLAEVLALVALLRVRLPEASEGPAARARPFLRASAALAPLAGLVLLLATLGDAPNDLLPLAAYAHLVLAGLLVLAALAAAAPFLGLAPQGGLRGQKAGAALLVAGLFLLAPAFQYDRAAFPGALVLVLGALLAARPFLARRGKPSSGRRAIRAR